MHTKTLFAICLVVCVSCKFQPESNRNNDGSSKIYTIKLAPESGTTYKYEIENEIISTVTTEGKDIETENISSIGATYKIDQDSSGNYIFHIRYDAVKLVTKANGSEVVLDSKNSEASLNQLERMLGMLVDANIMATISKGGDILSVSGYEELGEKIITSIDGADPASVTSVREQWNKTIGEGVVRKNLDQMFHVFPDSAVHIGDKWNLTSEEAGEMPFKVTSHYELKAINDMLAIIQASGRLSLKQQNATFAGVGNVNLALDGNQKSDLEIDARTGMLMRARIKSEVAGTIIVAGRELPIEIMSTVTISGKVM